jgi:hypothetical protein
VDNPTYTWEGPDGVSLQRTLSGTAFIQIGPGILLLTKRQIQALQRGLYGLELNLMENPGNGPD